MPAHSLLFSKNYVQSCFRVSCLKLQNMKVNQLSEDIITIHDFDVCFRDRREERDCGND